MLNLFYHYRNEKSLIKNDCDEKIYFICYSDWESLWMSLCRQSIRLISGRYVHLAVQRMDDNACFFYQITRTRSRNLFIFK